MKQPNRTHRRAAALLLAAAALPFSPAPAQETQPTTTEQPAAETPQPVETPAPAQETTAPVSVTPTPLPDPTPDPVAAETAAPAAAAAVRTTRTTRATRTTRTTATAPRAAPRAAAPAAAAPASVAPLAAAPAAPAPAADPALTTEVLPEPAAPVPPPAAAPAAAPAQEGGGSIWPWLLAGLLLAGALAFFARRRRRNAELVDDDYYEEAHQPAAAPLAEPVHAEPAYAAPVAAAAATDHGRPYLDLQMRPVRAGVVEEDARVEFELTVDNTGSAPARDVRISTWMLAAGSSEAERSLIEPRDHADTPPVTIDAGAARTMEAAVALPTSEVDGDAVLPVVVADATYTLPDGSEEHTTVRFAVGVPDGEDLAHFAIDNPSGLHEGVVARELAEPEHA